MTKWKVDRDSMRGKCWAAISTEDGSWIELASVVVRMKGDAEDYPKGLENLRMIAAAPEMLALLERVEDDWGETFDSDDPMNGGDAVEWLCQFIQDAREVIAKAKGEAA